jgi:nicotinamide mononucleotide (NMN) deamidase PncC
LADAVCDAPGPLEDISARACALLSEAGVQVAIAEAGTGGELADLLSSAAEGRVVITSARVYGSAEELAAGLRVSAAKVAAFDAMSAMVAAEAAAELIDTYEGGWGLVVMVREGNLPGGAGVPSEVGVAAPGFIALGTPSATVIRQCVRSEIFLATLELLEGQAEHRLETIRARTEA